MSWTHRVPDIDQRLAAAGLPPLPRHVWLEIDLDALTNNVAIVREIVGRAVGVNVVVKADAYGHGLLQTALAFEASGVDQLSVAGLDEGLRLREIDIRVPILVLFPVPEAEIPTAAQNGIELTLNSVPGKVPEGLVAQVEVETGLSRGGVVPDRVPELLAGLSDAGVRIGGMWTHLASPEDEAVTAGQLREFERATELVRDADLPVPMRHVAATGGFWTGRAPHYEGVRIGLGMYGLMPLDLPVASDLAPLAEKLRPAMVLKCKPLRIEQFRQGTRVGYGGRWTAQRDSWIATLPVGYADAIPRTAPWGEALVRGRRVPLVGTVAMDAVMADITDVMTERVTNQDEFVLLGSQGSEQITADHLARARTTIPWEVATSMSHRVPRVYHAGSVLMGLRTLNAETRVASTGVTTIGDPHR
jgi:alanine racemase